MLLFCEYDSYFYIIHYISKEEFEHIDFFIHPIFHFLKKMENWVNKKINVLKLFF